MRVSTQGLVALAALGVFAVPGFAERAASNGPYFVESAAQAGLDFVNYDGATGTLQFPEMMTSGAALFDCDGDGDLDAYAVQGGHLLPGDASEPLAEPPSGPLRDRLWRNDGAERPGGVPRFVDVTAVSGLDARGYGMAVAVGDLDGDGFEDLFVSNFGPDEFWRGRGDCKFENATKRSGIAPGDGWSVGAVAFDHEGDGDLDLFVLGYVDYDPAKNPRCFAANSRRDYCGPSAFEGAVNRLWRNRGDGTFEDATRAVGIDVEPMPSLGAVAADFDADGRLDLYVANDGAANRLWLAREDEGGSIRYADEAPLAGVAVDGRGLAEAGMGIAVGDVDRDADLDLLVTHLDGETNTLYLAQDGAFFLDRSAAWGLAASTPWTSFGVGFLDADGDGRLDAYVASGAVRREHGRPEPKSAEGSHALAQPDQLYLQRDDRWVDASIQGGAGVTTPTASRAAAFGDVDDDGDTDVFLVDTGGRARLLLSTLDRRLGGDHWIGLRLLDGPRAALGARVIFIAKDGTATAHRVATDGSYGAANDPRILLRFDAPPGEFVWTVHWADGTAERFSSTPRGVYTTLRRGEGRALGDDETPRSGTRPKETS